MPYFALQKFITGSQRSNEILPQPTTKMPGTLPQNGTSGKRKSLSSDKRPAKRARSESSEEDAQAQIFLLENEIFESKKNYNNVAKLIKLLQSDGDDTGSFIVAAVSLCRVFMRLMVSGDMIKKQGCTEKDIIVVKWLKERYSEYKSALLLLLGEGGFSSTALTLCMRLLKTEGEHLRNGQEYSFPVAFLTDIVQALLRPGSDKQCRKEFGDKYVEEYDDIRYHTFKAIESVLLLLQFASTNIDRNTLRDPQCSHDRKVFNHAVDIITSIQSVPESKEEIEDFFIPAPKKLTDDVYSLSKHKSRAQGAWLAMMNLEIDKEQRKLLLGLMVDSVAPWFIKPELLMDFLTDSYNSGGSTSLLALSGVFYLIQEKNLDYPLFYRKLYSLLDSEILHSKHRSRFFRLLDTFLSSTHLPVVLVASFLKRLSRLTLNATPSGIAPVIPWIYNILKKHPSCTFMIHRETRDPEAKKILENQGMADPFLMDEEDPMETHAIKSSLWEIVMLQDHFHPNLATLAKIVSEQFTKQAYNLEDFLDHSYASVSLSKQSHAGGLFTNGMRSWLKQIYRKK